MFRQPLTPFCLLIFESLNWLLNILIVTRLNVILLCPDSYFNQIQLMDYEFNPIPIDIHLGIIKIPTEEILDDDAINNTESVIVGTDRQEVLNRIQTAFAREFERYGKLKESDIRPMDYETKQAWTRIRKHIKNMKGITG